MMKAVRSSAKLMFARRRKLLVCLFLFCLQDAFGAAPPMPPFKYDRPDCLVHRLGTGREDGLTERNYQQVVASAPAIMIDIATRVGCYVVELRGGGPNLNVSFDNLLTDLDSLRVREKALVLWTANPREMRLVQNATFSFDAYLRDSRGWTLKPRQSSDLVDVVSHPERKEKQRFRGHLRIAFANFAPFAFNFRAYRNQRSVGLSGLDIEMWRIVLSKLGSAHSFVQAKTLADSVEQVKLGNADLSSMALFPNVAAQKGTGVILNMQERELALYAAYPRETSKYLTLVEPYDPKTWAITVLTLLSVCAILVLLTRLDNNAGGTAAPPDLFRISTLSFGVMINESLSEKLISIDKKSAALVIVLVTWIPISCLLGMAYQSNLRAFLIRARMEEPVDTFEDVLERGMTLYLALSTPTPSHMTSSQLPIIQRVYRESVLARGGLYDFNSKGRAPDHIYGEFGRGEALMDSINVRVAGRRHQMRKGKSLVIGTFPLGFYCRMNHPVAERAQEIFLLLNDAGILSKLTLDAMWPFEFRERHHYRTTPVAGVPGPLSLGHTGPIFVLAGSLLAVAIAVAAVERLSLRKKKTQPSPMSHPR